jgi:DNA (cytosine-5)-methyltransferase 1
MKNLTCVDLFAGMGGTSLGASQAGMRVLVAANHWFLSVATHRLNHPETEHIVQDLQQADFYTWPDFDVLLASPACQGHSRARGKEQPRHDAARSTAWAVVSAAEAKHPRYLVVENVFEFTQWSLYPQWRFCLESLGYQLTEQVLNAADFGVPQERRRLFVVGVRKDAGPALSIPQGSMTHVPARTIIDEGATNWSAIVRPGRSPATLRRIENGRLRLGQRFLAPYFGSGSGTTGRSLDRPIGTITTKDRYCLVDGDRMRMLTAREYLLAQGFPAHFRLPPTHRAAVAMIGNSVPPPMARAVCEKVLSHAHLWN